MDPISIALLAGGGAQVVSGLMQYYNSRKAAGESRKRLGEIERMFDAIVPPEYDLKIYDDPRLAADIPAPKLNLEAITPELYQQVGQYVPEVAQFVQEANPQLVQATEAAQTGRGAQLDALERYRQIASGEFDPELQQMLSAASERANREAQSRTASILQDFQRRGQLGSGMQLAAQQDAAAEAMARQARESQLAAAEGYRNRLLATDKSAALGGDIRASEMSEEARNVGILNSFNERTSKNYQDYLQMRADAANKARIMEVERARKVSDANIANRNEAARQNRQMYNQGQMTQYDVARQNRSNRLDLEERKNKVKQAMYDNLMSRARGKAGVAENRMNFENQNVRDTNQMIRGLGDVATAGAMYYGKYGKKDVEAGQSQGASSGGYVRPGYDDREANFYE
jgi:hypothetical protein